jgi:hypothetical protein
MSIDAKKDPNGEKYLINSSIFSIFIWRYMAEQLPRLYRLTGVQGLMAVLSIDDVTGERSPGRLLRRANTLLKSRIQGRFVATDLNAIQWIALKLVHDGEYRQKPPVMVEGWNELLADFETEEVLEMIRLPSKMLRTMELSAARRSIIASRKA